MCTIGVVFEHDAVHTFKQCDLIPNTEFFEPEMRDGTLVLSREGGHMWSSVNQHGVAFVAADSYTTNSAEQSASSDEVAALFAAYEEAAGKATVPDAVACMTAFYETMGGKGLFPAADISMFAGWRDSARTQPVSVLLEFMPNPFNRKPVRTIVRESGTFVSTNNFRLQPESVSYPANHSTYLRLQRAQQILERAPSKAGALELLGDQYYGPTELSICRETDWPGVEFRTQATAVFSASTNGPVECLYQINGNPRTNPLKPYGPI